MVLLQYGPVYAVAAMELWGWWREDSAPATTDAAPATTGQAA
jgi:hypothetical protein